LVITLFTGFIVIPLATGNHNAFDLFQSGPNYVQSNATNFNQGLIAQAATASACVHLDGCQPGSTNNGIVYNGSGVTPDHFAFGQCTYFADLEYHYRSGYWVNWIGDAWQWAYGAKAAGWIVSTTPHVPSIIVLQPYVQGASYFGHVAVVESINSDGSVYTSNYNWYANGGWDRLSYWTFRPGPGVVFVWHP
ncbi:MAG TPA: CHAP domain-containing protein, partial [Ktedonobacteraceae bacterium]|nr:CHAP domain-containing protein [Ktedonobacteraceae bacterium]